MFWRTQCFSAPQLQWDPKSHARAFYRIAPRLRLCGRGRSPWHRCLVACTRGGARFAHAEGGSAPRIFLLKWQRRKLTHCPPDQQNLNPARLGRGLQPTVPCRLHVPPRAHAWPFAQPSFARLQWRFPVRGQRGTSNPNAHGDVAAHSHAHHARMRVR